MIIVLLWVRDIRTLIVEERYRLKIRVELAFLNKDAYSPELIGVLEHLYREVLLFPKIG